MGSKRKYYYAYNFLICQIVISTSLLGRSKSFQNLPWVSFCVSFIYQLFLLYCFSKWNNWFQNQSWDNFEVFKKKKQFYNVDLKNTITYGFHKLIFLGHFALSNFYVLSLKLSTNERVTRTHVLSILFACVFCVTHSVITQSS